MSEILHLKFDLKDGDNISSNADVLHKLSMKDKLRLAEKQNIYNEWADSYNLYVKNQYYTAPNHLSKICLEYLHILRKQVNNKIITQLLTKLNVLDFGCGTGLLGHALYKNINESTIINNKDVIIKGVDISYKMIEKSQSLNVYENLICVDLTNKNKEEILKLLNLVDGVDLFISCGVFLEGHVSLDFIFKISSIVNSNGYLIFTVRKSFLNKFPTFFKQIDDNSSLSLEKEFDIPYLKDVNAKCIVIKKK